MKSKKYTYKCEGCGYEYYSDRYISSEVLEAGKVIHLKCGGVYKRVYSVPGINIKGTGKDNLDRRSR